ncbi:MAG TPA: YciI family protein [Opitutaceae bacterium]|nr:YciI family protein [Opitutaceae bacterium]
MQYALLIYQSETWESLPKEEKNRIHEDCGAWHEELVRAGHARTCFGLRPATMATTVRTNSGRALVTDGPFAETKEVLGGLEVVECKDLDQAIAIAKRFPALRVGFAMEVRPTLSGECKEE